MYTLAGVHLAFSLGAAVLFAVFSTLLFKLCNLMYIVERFGENERRKEQKEENLSGLSLLLATMK